MKNHLITIVLLPAAIYLFFIAVVGMLPSFSKIVIDIMKNLI